MPQTGWANDREWLHNYFNSELKYQIPNTKLLKPEDFELGENYKVRGLNYLSYFDKSTIGHLFTYDYILERFWNKPEKYIDKLFRAKFVLGPDFSIFTDMPQALSLFQVYRNRYLVAYYQEQGIYMAPSLSWGNEDSFEFAFLGIPINSVVAVSVCGINNDEVFRNFKNGFMEIMHVLSPLKIFVYGYYSKKKYQKFLDQFPIIGLEDRWLEKYRGV